MMPADQPQRKVVRLRERAREERIPTPTRSIPQILRERLITSISEAAEPVCMLLAPGGYGKTLLLEQTADRIRSQGGLVAFLTITSSSGRTMGGLTEAFARVSGHSFESDVSGALIDQALTLAGIEIVIVDDAHLADGTEGQLFFDALIDGVGPRRKLIVAASGAPPFPAARMSLSGQLKLFTAEELKCGATDVFDLLKAYGLAQPTLELCSSLEQHTEGWLAPIALLARDPDALARSIAQSRRQVLADSVRCYIEERFLQPLDPALCTALIEASTVDRLSASLFEALTGHSFFALDRYATLMRAELGETGMFRFNRIFLRVLRERLDGVGAERRATLHRRAAVWFTQAGRLTEAAYHALECGDQDFAAEAINRGARAFIANGEISEALSWLGQFDPSQLETYPLIRLYYVTALTISGRFQEADAENAALALDAQHEERAASRASAEEIGNQTLFHRELIGTWRRDANQTTIEQIIERMSGRRTWIFGEAVWLHGIQHFQRGEFTAARQKLMQSEAPLVASGSWYALAVGQATIAQLDYYAGDVSRARARCRTLIQELLCGAGYDIPATAMPRLLLAKHAYEAGDTDEAASEFASARQHLAALSSPEWTVRSYLLQTAMSRVEDRSAAMELAERAVAMEHDHQVPVLAARARATLARYLAEAGRREEALQVIDADGLLPRTAEVKPTESFRARWVRIAARMRLDVSSGHAERVEGQISALVNTAERSGLLPYIIEAQLTAALSLFALGERAKAARALREAILAAQRSGLPRLLMDFLDPSLLALVRELDQDMPIQTGDPNVIDRDFIRMILGGQTPWRGAVAGAQQYRDLFRQRSLTDKEIEVLELVETGLSNQQIADELFISVGTVKWHVRNILNKLGAQNRTAAIRLAKSIASAEI